MDLIQELYRKVFDQYFSNLEKLEKSDRYHLLHHIYLWDQDPKAKAELDKVRSEYTLDKDHVNKYLESFITGSELPIKNAASLRQPYLNKHPKVRSYSRLLLEAIYLDSVFGYDARPVVWGLTSQTELDKVFDELIVDPKSIAILSSFSSNFLYIYDRYFGDGQKLSEKSMFEIGKTQYDLSDPDQFILKLYFYTHNIINETLFYWRGIPAEKLSLYQEMVKDIDGMLASNFYGAHMDVKFEAIVCARICGITLSVENRIYEEALNSVSAEGNFIIDRHNNVPQTNRADFKTSEHRNVLFLMSCLPFKPKF